MKLTKSIENQASEYQIDAKIVLSLDERDSSVKFRATANKILCSMGHNKNAHGHPV